MILLSWRVRFRSRIATAFGLPGRLARRRPERGRGHRRDHQRGTAGAGGGLHPGKALEGHRGPPRDPKVSGALREQNARKGVFITTSSGFSKEAVGYASRLQGKVVLVDGKPLANLMVDYGVGVSLERPYEVKRLDSDYFDEA